MKNALSVLLRFAKSEYQMEMNKSRQKATRTVTASAARHDAKPVRQKPSALAAQPEPDLGNAIWLMVDADIWRFQLSAPPL
jgi:hypothetical protein